MERVHCLLVLVAMIASDVSQPVVAQESFCQADIVLVVDHSGSIRNDDVTGQKPNWQIILDFLASVVDLLDISPDETRIGMVTFGSYATLEFDLDDHKSKNDVDNAIKSVAYTGGSTNTTGALRMARTQVLSPAGGDRPDVRDLIVLLTDGVPTIEEDRLGDEVRTIKGSGTRIIAIGVTEGVDEDLMKIIASDPVEKHYFHVLDFAGLDQLSGILAEEACDAPSTTSAPVTQSPDACTSKGDVIFVMDSSGSVGKENFETMKEFVVEIANGLDINSGNVQVGVATFSSDVKLQFHLNEKKNLNDVTSAVKAINYTRGTTNTGAALQLLYSSMFTAANGDRPNINNIGLVLTDGGSNDKEDTHLHALTTKVAGHTMLALGIGSWVDQTELNAIASHPPTDNTFNVKSFADLGSVVQTVTALICDSVNECNSNPCENDGTCINAINAYYCQCGVGYGGINCEKICPLRADVAFALDSSGSVGSQNFIKEVNFVKQVVQHLNLNGQSRIAVENFANNAVVRFQLNSYDNVQKVLNGLSIYYKGGSTNTADAINKMRTEMFTSSNGDRANMLNVGVVITDGKSNDRAATLREASLAQDAGIVMMAVGVGDGVNTLELEGIASYPSSANVFYSDSFDSFDQTLDSLVGSICNGVNECDSNPCQNGADCTDLINGYLCQCQEGFSGINCERDCSGEIDLGFIVDSSGSIGSRRFPKVLNFIASVAQNLTFGPGGAQVGVVTYSDQAAVRIALNAYSSVSTLTSAIKNIPYDGKRTNTSGGIWMMSSALMTSPGGDRPSIPNVAIIITDGCTNRDMDRTIPSALEAKTNGNHMISIGIGGDVNELELRAIASDPQSENLLYADSWKDLPGIVTSLLNSMCNDVDECSARPCQNGGSCIDMLKKFHCDCATGFSGVNCDRSCSRPMDIGFVLDISGSVQVVLDYTVAITKAIVYGLPIGSNMARVGLVSFSEDAAVNFNLNSYQSTLEVLNAIGFAKAGGTTNTQEALDLMRTQLFRSSAGDRNGVPNKAVVITDGRSNVRQRNTIPAAQTAQNDGIEIFVVAVSKDQPGGPDMAEVNGIASDPDSTHVFQVSSTADIDTAVGQLLDALCQQN